MSYIYHKIDHFSLFRDEDPIHTLDQDKYQKIFQYDADCHGNFLTNNDTTRKLKSIDYNLYNTHLNFHDNVNILGKNERADYLVLNDVDHRNILGNVLDC
jgi:hypothetical protein